VGSGGARPGEAPALGYSGSGRKLLRTLTRVSESKVEKT
jgi:hypothetical protein